MSEKGCVWRAICLFVHSYTTRVLQYNLYETLKLFIYTCYRIENSSATSKGNKTYSQEVKSEELTWYSDAKYGQGLVSCSHLSELSSERKTLISSSWQEIYSNVECLTTGYLACMKQRLIMLYGCWYAFPSTSTLLWYSNWVNNVWKPLEFSTNWVKNFSQIHLCACRTFNFNL